MVQISKKYTGVDWSPQVRKVLRASEVKIKDVRPSTFAEERIVLNLGGKPGPLRYAGTTMYNKEIIDFLSPDHPGRELFLMGSAQIGKTMTLIIPALAWIIENDPAPIIITVGHADLIEGMMAKIDAMLDSTGLRRLIKPQAKRNKNLKSGDTNNRKEFPGGYLVVRDASNPKIWRQEEFKYLFIDDYDAVKAKSKAAGSVKFLIDQRSNSYSKVKKVVYLSSPELAGKSNIEEGYKLGDQRKYYIPCPCCGTGIDLQFECKTSNGQPAGITWQLDEDNKLIEDSVCYTCQECGDSFTDQNKTELVDAGYWKPTAKAHRPEFLSYYINGLYAPAFMADWKTYVYKYLEANPPGGNRVEDKYQTFLNVMMGLPYDGVVEDLPKGSELQLNTRDYPVNLIPDRLSTTDGNGRVIMLTLAADCNGTETDARLDWEILAHSETQSTYSIAHGSIGTFVPAHAGGRTKKHLAKEADRVKWSYVHGAENCVWPVLDKILDTIFESDSGTRSKIFIAAVDSGRYTNHVYAYQDRTNHRVVLVKGDNEERYTRVSQDLPIFKPARERVGLYILEVGRVKDRLAEYMQLKNTAETQPPNFMNFPMPESGLYGFENYFAHFESEHRVISESKDGTVTMRWVKKKQGAQNHMWDCRVYGLAVREIAVWLLRKDLKIPGLTWADVAKLFKR